MDAKACKRIGGRWQNRPMRACTIDNTTKINSLIKHAKHLGTEVIRGGGGLKTKTFNAYKKGKEIIVTNHYGLDLVNAKIYATKSGFELDYPHTTWEKYTVPFAP